VSTAHLLWHVPEGDEYKENAKLIGVYASAEDAASAVERLKSKPGFVNFPQGFEIGAYQIGRDHWEEGFGFVED
jgi:homoserine kinase type II